jgi:hypothetical protein
MPPKKKVEKDLVPRDNKPINYYEHVPKELLKEPDNPNFNLHHLKLPFRMCVVAPSGSGKTNFVVNLIHMFCAGKGTFADILILTRNKAEPLYQWLEKKGEDRILIKEGLQNLPPLDKFDKDENHLIILDDLVLEKDLSRVEQYYIRCRKMGVTIIFLSQSFFKIPKLIRTNCNYLVILKLNGDRDCKLILTEFGLGVSKEAMVKIYEDCTREKFNFLLVDIEAPKEERLRHNFIKVLNPLEYEI